MGDKEGRVTTDEDPGYAAAVSLEVASEDSDTN